MHVKTLLNLWSSWENTLEVYYDASFWENSIRDETSEAIFTLQNVGKATKALISRDVALAQKGLFALFMIYLHFLHILPFLD